MSLYGRAWSGFAAPLKGLLDRLSFVALLAVSLACLSLGRIDPARFDRITGAIVDAALPALALLSAPVDRLRSLERTIGELLDAHRQNEALRLQLALLRESSVPAEQLASENDAFRALLRLAPADLPPTAATARVIADAGSPFLRTLLIDAGSERRIEKGMAAVNQDGLAGRVIAVGRRSARVLLLSDLNSRVPVMVLPSRDQAILAGDNAEKLLLTFLPQAPRLSVGDRVVTSGRGGMLPPGLMVGRVGRIRPGEVRVDPAVAWNRLEFVRLLDYQPVTAPEDEGSGGQALRPSPPADR